MEEEADVLLEVATCIETEFVYEEGLVQVTGSVLCTAENEYFELAGIQLTKPPEISEDFIEDWLKRPYSGNTKYVDRAAREELGRAGEDRILSFERERLIRLGHKELAKKVAKTTKEDGTQNYLEYDIYSFNEEGKEICIEVKTTEEPRDFPFVLNERQLSASDRLGERYFLYRLYDFAKSPKLFILQGPLTPATQRRAKEIWGWPSSAGAIFRHPLHPCNSELRKHQGP